MKTKILAVVLGCISGIIATYLWFSQPKHHRCVFDRNEPGPLGANGGQWWWEYYKCDDGTERRMLVAGPRG